MYLHILLYARASTYNMMYRTRYNVIILAAAFISTRVYAARTRIAGCVTPGDATDAFYKTTQ